LVSAASAQHAPEARTRSAAPHHLPQSIWIVPAAALVLLGFAAVMALA
jgi:hypothetical protein